MSLLSQNDREVNLSRPQMAFFTSTQPVNLFMAGVGSGKTFLDGLISYQLASRYPEVRGFIGANTYDQLNSSTLSRIRDVWRDVYGLVEPNHYVVGITPPKHFNTKKHNFERYDNIISFINGAVIFKGSMENYKIHEGKEMGWALLDETKDTKEEAVREVILARLRQQGIYVQNGKIIDETTDEPYTTGEPFNPLYITTTPAKVRWINEWFEIETYQDEITSLIYSKDKYFSKKYKDKMMVISSTYHNKNLPITYIESIKNNNTEENAKRLIYANPFTKAGGEFYSSFNRERHVKPVQFNPNLAVHISFDQNLVPYITLKCYQIEQVGDIWYERHFDEFCLSSPHNKTEDVCNEFIRKYGYGLKHGLYYYGDASGRKDDTRRGEDDYEIVARVLSKYLQNTSNRVMYKNPAIIKRRDFTNNIFDERYNIRVEIDSRCRNTILDYEFLKEDMDGKKLKELVKDTNTGQTYQKYGHCSDADDYFRCSIYRNLYENNF